ncbi:MAG: HEAT repeat domain-containing protein [Chloroflexota bacterium]
MPMSAVKRRQAAVLGLLSCVELDGFVVAQIRSTEGAAEVLRRVAGGRLKATAHQRRGATYVLGRLGDAESAPVLIDLLRNADRKLRLSAGVALAALDLDEPSRAALIELADREDADPVEAAYLREAVAATRQRAIQTRVRTLR